MGTAERARGPAQVKIPIRSNQCFLCGRRLDSPGSTAEHVFPKWLLKRYGIWDDDVIMLHGRRKPYRKVRIPCCANCNNRTLSRLESTIRNSLDAGYSQFIRIDQQVIFQWLLKIFYELLHLEKRTFLNPARPQEGAGISAAELERFQACYSFLQSLYIPTRFTPSNPWSIFFFRTKTYAEKRLNFDFRDNTRCLTIAIRMDDVGIIACLQDNGAVRPLIGKGMDKFKNHTLHPLQFLELAGHIFYHASRLNRIPKFVTVRGDGQQQILALPLGGFSRQPIFDPWVPEQCARMLSAMWRRPLTECFTPPDRVGTLLTDARGRFRRLEDSG